MIRVLPAVLLAITASLQVISAPIPTDQKGAKGMFYEQLDRPTEKLNNGIQYWIELRRAGQTQAVSNKHAFKSGDQIRFHVISNTDGFAYVVLKEGSQGETALLFPDSRHADDNRINAKQEYSIPSDDFLLFDQHPGTERVTLVLTRHLIEPTKFAPESIKEKVVVASRPGGSKDLVPGSFVVAYGGANDGVTKPAPTVTPSDITGLVNSTTTTTPNEPRELLLTPRANKEQDSAATTIVQKNPSDALAVEIFLEHTQ